MDPQAGRAARERRVRSLHGTRNRQILLAETPNGKLSGGHIELTEAPVPAPADEPGETVGFDHAIDYKKGGVGARRTARR